MTKDEVINELFKIFNHTKKTNTIHADLYKRLLAEIIKNDFLV